MSNAPNPFTFLIWRSKLDIADFPPGYRSGLLVLMGLHDFRLAQASNEKAILCATKTAGYRALLASPRIFLSDYGHARWDAATRETLRHALKAA